jgi:hypothetical protein
MGTTPLLTMGNFSFTILKSINLIYSFKIITMQTLSHITDRRPKLSFPDNLIKFSKDANHHNHEPPRFNPGYLLFIVTIALGSYTWINHSKPFIQYDDTGQANLAEWRKDKLSKELQGLEYAEQYALVAKVDGYYPCFSCPSNQKIQLNKGDIWKYGFTPKGRVGRYPASLESKNLIYVIQHTGTIEAYLNEERKKIYYYALSSEKLKRVQPLIRPPGNKQDS